METNKKLAISAAVAIVGGSVALLLKTNAMRKINTKGLALIKKFEGLRLTAYLCPAGVWTIGYGHTHNVKEGQTITEKQAETLLKNDLEVFESSVRQLTKNVELTGNQFSALVSFAFNCGIGNLKKSTLLKKVLLEPRDPSIADEFGRWVYGGGVVLPGLVKRRKEESDLYFS